MGGDEFLLLLMHGGAATEAVAERVREATGADSPCDLSIGFANRIDGEPLERTIERADRHLYTARIADRLPHRPRGVAAGRGCWASASAATSICASC
jgi:GGDEF domain-containing protein